MATTDLSVIILSFNTRNLLRRCLQSVEESIKNFPSVEIIVVDNASTDGSGQMVKKEFPQMKLIENKKNLGYAGGNNSGLKKAKGRFIIFLNSDTEIYPDALKETVKFMETDSRIGAMTPKTMLFSGRMDPDCHRGFPTPWASLTYFAGLEKFFPKSRIFGQYHKFYENLDSPHEIDAGFGTFMAIRREVYKQVGEWDERYFFYGEDLDYFYRIRQSGWKVMFFPKTLLRHHKGGSSGLRKESQNITPATKETRVKTAKASIKAMEIFYRKFYRNKYPLFLTALVIFAIRIKGFFRILSHQFNNN